VERPPRPAVDDDFDGGRGGGRGSVRWRDVRLERATDDDAVRTTRRRQRRRTPSRTPAAVSARLSG
jgi:hypothetical protein